MLGFVGVASTAGAIVKCTTPDSLCRGNPCVIGQIEVASPCVLDFGARKLVIGGALKVPNGGTLDLTADDIEVRRAIVGRHAKPFEGIGSKITLTAHDDILVGWRIDASARSVPGEISLIAGGDIVLQAPVRAAANGPNPNAAGGSITIDAGGQVVAIGRARIRAEGAASTAGGTVSISAVQSVNLLNRVGADGRTGGSIAIISQRGNVSTTLPLSARGRFGDGGSIALFAATGVLTVRDRVDAEGTGAGGSAFLVGNRSFTNVGQVRAGGGLMGGVGGQVVIASNGAVSVQDTLYADGSHGGSIQVLSTAGSVHTLAPLLADGKTGTGGTVQISSGTTTTVDQAVDADGGLRGGNIAVLGPTVTVTDHGSLSARGDTGGSIAVDGGSIAIEVGAKVLADGDLPGGTIHFDATAGDLTLSGDFRARGATGGSIQGSAARALLANGAFAARGNGCIGLSAGTLLDIASGDFDVPVVTSCP
ncbi:MAG TPA: hypothetical protein VGC36_05940 [Rhizomicrobium sp.]